MSPPPLKKDKCVEGVEDEKGVDYRKSLYEIPGSILEILFHFLAFYEVCRNSRISKRCRSLCTSSLRLRQTAALNKGDRNQAAQIMAKNCKRITSLIIAEDSRHLVDEHYLRSVLDNNPHISTISAPKISTDTCKVLEKPPYLHIHIDELAIFTSEKTYSRFRNPEYHSKNEWRCVKEIIARNSDSIKRLQHKGHWSHALKCSNLEVLDMSTDFLGLRLTDFSEVAQSCPKLKTLCIDHYYHAQLDLSSLVALEELVFDESVGNSTGFASLVHLKTVEFIWFDTSIKEYLPRVIQAPNLRNLRLNLTSREQFQIILEGCASLRKLCTKIQMIYVDPPTPDNVVKWLIAKGVRSSTLVSWTLSTDSVGIIFDDACDDVLLVAPNLKYLKVGEKDTKFGVVSGEILVSPWPSDRIEILKLSPYLSS